MSEHDTIKIRKDALWKYSTFILLGVLIIGWYMTSDGGFGEANNAGNKPFQSPPTAGEKVKVNADDDAFKGDKNAPITIIEFSDYECPFCTRFYTQTLAQIQKEYIDTGKVKFVYRDFPLGFHQNAQKAAEAAECAGEQDKYFELHDKLFDNGVAGGIASFKQFAGQIGLNQGDFDNCLDSGKMASEVKKDFQDGQSYGVSGTPAFFVNGKLISGAQPFSAFKQVIDAELN
jgi:protein-disulfide isomerase